MFLFILRYCTLTELLKYHKYSIVMKKIIKIYFASNSWSI